MFLLGENLMKMVNVIFGIIAFVGISIDFVVQPCGGGGFYTMFVAVWPTIFGIVAIWRMAVLVGYVQLYHAALRRGKCFGMVMELSKWHIVLACSWIVLTLCVDLPRGEHDGCHLALEMEWF
mmetsp:Transcript_6825/g.25570  ORF Transcript_6825/g.25570 Transcript_6825/m.25570 type:complete len:122 (-) Transcript_6825:124-489(-)